MRRPLLVTSSSHFFLSSLSPCHSVIAVVLDPTEKLVQLTSGVSILRYTGRTLLINKTHFFLADSIKN